MTADWCLHGPVLLKLEGQGHAKTWLSNAKRSPSMASLSSPLALMREQAAAVWKHQALPARGGRGTWESSWGKALLDSVLQHFWAHEIPESLHYSHCALSHLPCVTLHMHLSHYFPHSSFALWPVCWGQRAGGCRP